MEIPHLGTVTKDQQFGCYYSLSIPIPVLGGIECQIVLEDYDEDEAKEDFHTTILNFLSASPDVLKAAEPHLFRYYQYCNADFDPTEEGYLEIPTPEGVWRHIQFGTEPVVTRRAYGDKGVYVSLECNCDWEQEHGLQIVFKNGLSVNKVGPYDGHLTNSDAYAQDELEDVVYR